MTRHAEDALRRPRISEILNLALAVAAAEAAGTEGLIAGQDCQVLDLVAARAAAVSAVVADERAIAEQQQIGVGVEESAAGIASEAVDVPSISRCSKVSRVRQLESSFGENIDGKVLTEFECFAFFEDLCCG